MPGFAKSDFDEPQVENWGVVLTGAQTDDIVFNLGGVS